MEIIHMSQTLEKISVEVRASVVWEVILGIAGYTYGEMRHTFDLDEEWTEDSQAMPAVLLQTLEEIQVTNLWYAMVMLQNNWEAETIEDFYARMEKVSAGEFYSLLLPYKDWAAEQIRKEAAANWENKKVLEAYGELFENHNYLGGYIQVLARKPIAEIKNLLVSALVQYGKWMAQKEKWMDVLAALASEQKLYKQVAFIDPAKEISKITGGVIYYPEPSVWHVKLVPQWSYRPWVLEMRTPDTKLFFYPIKEEYFLKAGDPPKGLVRGHKALGDETRLKLLFELKKGPLSLQELSMKMQLSKTTLHHQLSLLKAAKFVAVSKGVYSINRSAIQEFENGMSRFLEKA